MVHPGENKCIIRWKMILRNKINKYCCGILNNGCQRVRLSFRITSSCNCSQNRSERKSQISLSTNLQKMMSMNTTPPELIDVEQRPRSDPAQLPDGVIEASDQAYVDVVLQSIIDMRQVSIRSFEDQTHFPETKTYITTYNHCLLYKGDIVWRLKNKIEYAGKKSGHPVVGQMSTCKMLEGGILQVKIREKGPLRIRKVKLSGSEKRFYNIETIIQASAAAYQTKACKRLKTPVSQPQILGLGPVHNNDIMKARQIEDDEGQEDLFAESRNDDSEVLKCPSTTRAGDDVRSEDVRLGL